MSSIDVFEKIEQADLPVTHKTDNLKISQRNQVIASPLEWIEIGTCMDK